MPQLDDEDTGAMRRLSLSPLTAPQGPNSQLPFTPLGPGNAAERNSDLLELKTVRTVLSLGLQTPGCVALPEA